MNTLEYLTEVKKKRGISSDYAVAKELGISKQAVSRYSQGKGSFDETVAKRVAEILGMHPGIVVLDMEKERAKDPEMQALWSEIYKGFWRLVPLANDRRALPRPVVTQA